MTVTDAVAPLGVHGPRAGKLADTGMTPVAVIVGETVARPAFTSTGMTVLPAMKVTRPFGNDPSEAVTRMSNVTTPAAAGFARGVIVVVVVARGAKFTMPS